MAPLDHHALRTPRTGFRPRIFAHRGDSSRKPENTLEAARFGFEAGADAWELDTQLSRDGVPIVLHDDSLIRTTDVDRQFPTDGRRESGFLARDFDWDEIQTLDAGAWHPGSEESRSNIRVPSLEQALALTHEQQWLVNVELKADDRPYGPLLEAVLTLIDRFAMADRVLISSFDHDAVLAAARRRPEIVSAALVHEQVEQVDCERLRRLGIDFLHVSVESLGLSPTNLSESSLDQATRLVRSIRDRGLGVQVYTVNDPKPDGLATALARIGVEGVFTDHPSETRRLFDATAVHARIEYSGSSGVAG